MSFSVNIEGKYFCEVCDYYTSRKSSIVKHNATPKHQNAQKSCKSLNKKVALEQKSCNICGKEYNCRNSLWYHKNKCNNKIDDSLADIICVEKLQDHNGKNYEELMINLITQNIELQKQVIELCKEKSIIVNNTINNQSFNMNVFLNEQCKDALNIGEFVNSLPLTLEDLENTGRVGYVKGLTDIVIRGLKNMDVHKRPIHCSDLKREVIYVKDNDVWQKDENNVKVKKAIQHIGCRNFKQIKEWTDKYPEAKDISTKKHEQYVGIRLKCTGGSDAAEDEKLHSKILSNIAKVIHINK
jgi:hypothetical protein